MHRDQPQVSKHQLLLILLCSQCAHAADVTLPQGPRTMARPQMSTGLLHFEAGYIQTTLCTAPLLDQ